MYSLTLAINPMSTVQQNTDFEISSLQTNSRGEPTTVFMANQRRVPVVSTVHLLHVSCAWRSKLLLVNFWAHVFNVRSSHIVFCR